MPPNEERRGTPPAEVSVGDRVYYLPDNCHATNQNADGSYPYVMGLRTATFDQRTQKQSFTVRELDDRQLKEYLNFVRRSPNVGAERGNLVPLRPAAAWPAIVTAVNANGTVDLDVASNNGGVTLHYRNIKVDRKRKRFHSCYTLDAADHQQVTAIDHATFTKLKTEARLVVTAPEPDPEDETPEEDQS